MFKAHRRREEHEVLMRLVVQSLAAFDEPLNRVMVFPVGTRMERFRVENVSSNPTRKSTSRPRKHIIVTNRDHSFFYLLGLGRFSVRN